MSCQSSTDHYQVNMALFRLCVLAALLIGVSANTEFASSLNTFNGKFEEQTAKQTKDENSIQSAISAEIALAMLLEGAGGTTATEIQSALILNDKKSDSQAFKEFIEDLGNVKDVELKMANALFVAPPDSGRLDSIQPDYQSLVRSNYKSDIRQVDFSKSVEAAANMNKWVEDQTNDRIKDLIDPQSLNEFTKAILINAIYFKGNWLHPFKETSTHKQNFTRSNGSPVEIDMMHQSDNFLYKNSAELKSKILVLPYKNEDMTMVIVLPEDVNGLPELEKKLVSGLNQHTQGLEKSYVHITLPKFTIETTLDVADICQKIGIKQLFTPQANLEHIFFEPGVYVSKAIQKAFIEVNERGSEAAVATAFQIVGYSAYFNPNAVYFTADHGFYYAIKYKTNTFFSGTVRSG